MNLNQVSVNVLIKGRPITEFRSPMDFQTYIEGRDGSEFELQIVNNTQGDVEAILSIDGLSITDGKPAGDASSGYLVPGRGTVTIPGWKVDGETAAKFVFASQKGGSYVEKIGGDALNKGVIGAKVYARKPTLSHFRAAGGFSSLAKGMGSRGLSASNAMSSMGGGSLYGSSLTASASTASLNNSTTLGVGIPAVDDTPMGTDFGAATSFNTTSVDFERGDLLAMMVIYYGSVAQLRRVGIDPTVKVAARPSAFPADEKGCVAPVGWSK